MYRLLLVHFHPHIHAGGGSLPLSRGCSKTKFAVPAGDEFTAVRIPFNSFSDMWSPATGEQTKTCAQDKTVCPTPADLAKIIRIEVWAEGVAGKVHLELKSISSAPASGVPSRSAAKVKGGSSKFPVVSSLPPAQYNTCKGPLQPKLLYGISGRTTPTTPIPVDDNETLADAVCCDSRMLAFAEPQFLFQAPDINLFARMSSEGVTVFYDSVCGVPVFRTPVNRTLADFQSDTNEHGWPSFRSMEVFHENVHTDMGTSDVKSVCGTHLGSYLPDSAGPRWCIDLSCISGSKLTSNY